MWANDLDTNINGFLRGGKRFRYNHLIYFVIMNCPLKGVNLRHELSLNAVFILVLIPLLVDEPLWGNSSM